jgi:hypothetical protein
VNGYPQWGPPEPPHREAGRALLSGFAGCLGVGLALVFVLVVLVILGAALGRH